MEEEVFDPIITKAFEKWKKSFSWKWVWLWIMILIGLGIGYWKITVSEWRFVVVSVMSGVIMVGTRLPWLVKEMISISSQNRLHNTHVTDVDMRLQTLFWQKMVLWSWWMIGIIAIKRVGWFAENIDNGTALFLLYLPAVWLFEIPRVINGFLALIIIPFLPFFLAFGMERTAEIWAVILYFLLVTATIQMAKEVKNENN